MAVARTLENKSEKKDASSKLAVSVIPNSQFASLSKERCSKDQLAKRICRTAYTLTGVAEEKIFSLLQDSKDAAQLYQLLDQPIKQNNDENRQNNRLTCGGPWSADRKAYAGTIAASTLFGVVPAVVITAVVTPVAGIAIAFFAIVDAVAGYAIVSEPKKKAEKNLNQRIKDYEALREDINFYYARYAKKPEGPDAGQAARSTGLNRTNG